MAIYDCIQYFNEDHILDLRFHILNDKIDYFVVSESTKTHQGKEKKLNFNLNNFDKFKKKIIYVVADYDGKIDFVSHEGGESKIEQHQRNSLMKGIEKADENDLIILSDSDEIPDLDKLRLIDKRKKFIAFSQSMYMYKLNLQNLEESNWIGSRITKKKNIDSMQKLRNLKFKDYPFWRLDKRSFQIIKGGWHFSFLQTPEDIAKKISSYSHGEFNLEENTNIKNIENKIKNNADIFDRNINLKKVKIDSSFPDFIVKNQENLSNWVI